MTQGAIDYIEDRTTAHAEDTQEFFEAAREDPAGTVLDPARITDDPTIAANPLKQIDYWTQEGAETEGGIEGGPSLNPFQQMGQSETSLGTLSEDMLENPEPYMLAILIVAGAYAYAGEGAAAGGAEGAATYSAEQVAAAEAVVAGEGTAAEIATVSASGAGEGVTAAEFAAAEGSVTAGGGTVTGMGEAAGSIEALNVGTAAETLGAGGATAGGAGITTAGTGISGATAATTGLTTGEMLQLGAAGIGGIESYQANQQAEENLSDAEDAYEREIAILEESYGRALTLDEQKFAWAKIIDERNLERADAQDLYRRGLVSDMMSDARIGEDELQTRIGDASSDVTRSYSKARGISDRNMSRMGIDPTSGAYADISKSDEMKLASADVAARNRARTGVREEERGLTQRARLSGLGLVDTSLGLRSEQLAVNPTAPYAARNLGSTYGSIADRYFKSSQADYDRSNQALSDTLGTIGSIYGYYNN